MREMISEATRTIEDSQTAQALHGLLSLKSELSSRDLPALLRAVGRQINPSGHHQGDSPPQQPSIQMIQTADGQTIEVSEVPPAVATVVVGTEQDQTIMVQSAPAAMQAATAGEPKPKPGSVMELLMQMQSQANAAAASGVQRDAKTTTMTLSSIKNLFAAQPAATATTTTVSALPTLATRTAPATATLPFAAGQTSPGPGLTQLLQTLQPATPTGTTPAPITTLIRTDKGQTIPVQLIQPMAGSERPGEMLAGLPMGVQPIVLQAQPLMVNTSTAATAPSPALALQQAREPAPEPNRSPLKKRPYPFSPDATPPQTQAALSKRIKVEQGAGDAASPLTFLVKSTQATSPTCLTLVTSSAGTPAMAATSPGVPLMTLSPGLSTLAAIQQLSSPSKATPQQALHSLLPRTPTPSPTKPAPQLPASSLASVLAMPALSALSSTNSLVMSLPTATVPTATALIPTATSTVPAATATAEGNKSQTLISLINTPPVSQVDKDSRLVAAQSTATSQPNMAVAVSEGYDDIFRYVRVQMEQLRAGEVHNGLLPATETNGQVSSTRNTPDNGTWFLSTSTSFFKLFVDKS